jgi:hypothetical protein
VWRAAGEKRMLNLKKSIVSDFWKRTDARLARVLSVMENIEHWVVDDVEVVARKLADAGRKMDQVSKETLARVTDEVLFVMAYISCGKALRLLHWMDDTHPGLSVHYVMEAKKTSDWAPSRLMVDRLQTVKGLSLMGRIFAPARMRLVERLLKEEGQ